MDAVIYNISDLKEEIERLKASKRLQETAIKSHFNSPGAIFHTITSLFKHNQAPGESSGLFGAGQDMVSLISRFVLPFILNKTLFRSSNFIIKTAVGLLSQKASGFINEKSVTSVWDKIRSVIPNLIHKNKKPAKPAVDYGIPPDSESY
ncbi:MAG: hypothetical protein ABIN91_09090 [Mucilaginibacter sp.]|uniref:hypothetical protein n=1 Tax=Mucilaginibacter sp. TaxID=1882438 RepID=UPI003263F130